MPSAPQVHSITSDETRNISVDMSGLLDAGELLTGTPTVQCSDDLMITNVQLNTGTVSINNRDVAAGKAVQFTVSSSVAGYYGIEILVGTSSAQTLEGQLNLSVAGSRY